MDWLTEWQNTGKIGDRRAYEVRFVDGVAHACFDEEALARKQERVRLERQQADIVIPIDAPADDPAKVEWRALQQKIEALAVPGPGEELDPNGYAPEWEQVELERDAH